MTSTSSTSSARSSTESGTVSRTCHAGDLGDDVVQALEVLDVDRGVDVDAGGEQLLDVLPALGVAGAGRVGVGQLVHQEQRGMAGERGVEIELLERARRGSRSARRGRISRPSSSRGGLRPAVGLDDADHDVERLPPAWRARPPAW